MIDIVCIASSSYHSIITLTNLMSLSKHSQTVLNVVLSADIVERLKGVQIPSNRVVSGISPTAIFATVWLTPGAVGRGTVSCFVRSESKS